MVKVARSCDTGVARGRVIGIERPALPWTVAKDRNFWEILAGPVSLNVLGFTKRANMIKGE
jgi:hypothetical protein